jgi:hypothetical protein
MSKHVPDTAAANAALGTTREASRRDHKPYQVRHLDEIDWETIRWPGETGKMLFHPRPEDPTQPNAGILRLEPGAYHPEHYHGFAQVWLVLKGEFSIDGRLCTPGTMLYHPDPHFEGEFRTETGGEIMIVQYPGPTTAERPIYAGRFDMEKRKPVASRARLSAARAAASRNGGPASRRSRNQRQHRAAGRRSRRPSRPILRNHPRSP